MNAAQVVNHQLTFSMASFIRTIGSNDQRLTNWMCLVFFVCVQACLAGAAPAACCAASQPVWVRGSLMAVAATRLLRSLWGQSLELSSTLRWVLKRFRLLPLYNSWYLLFWIISITKAATITNFHLPSRKRLEQLSDELPRSDCIIFYVKLRTFLDRLWLISPKHC